MGCSAKDIGCGQDSDIIQAAKRRFVGSVAYFPERYGLPNPDALGVVRSLGGAAAKRSDRSRSHGSLPGSHSWI